MIKSYNMLTRDTTRIILAFSQNIDGHFARNFSSGKWRVETSANARLRLVPLFAAILRRKEQRWNLREMRNIAGIRVPPWQPKPRAAESRAVGPPGTWDNYARAPRHRGRAVPFRFVQGIVRQPVHLRLVHPLVNVHLRGGVAYAPRSDFRWPPAIFHRLYLEGVVSREHKIDYPVSRYFLLDIYISTRNFSSSLELQIHRWIIGESSKGRGCLVSLRDNVGQVRLFRSSACHRRVVTLTFVTILDDGARLN